MTMPENQLNDPTTGVLTTVSPRHGQGAPTSGPPAQESGGSLRDVADTAKEETSNVAQEAGDQAKELWNQTREELVAQAGAQQQRAAQGLRALGDELREMSRSSQQKGLASDLARQGAGLTTRAASWLEQRQPGDLVQEVGRYASSKPGTFLLIAAAVGVAGGRLTRGLARGADGSDVTDIREHARTAPTSYGELEADQYRDRPSVSPWTESPTGRVSSASDQPPVSPTESGATEPRYAGGTP